MRQRYIPDPTERRRVRALAAALLFIIATFGAWVMWPRPAPPEPRTVRRQHSALPEQPRASARRLESPTAARTSVISPPVIDAVVVEKPELCEGEETLVSVVAHTTNDSDAELHFSEGVLEGLKLIGFAVWERRSGGGRNVTFPARQYSVNGERRSFALLRPIADTAAQERVRDLVLQAYAEYEETATEAAS